MYSLLLKFQHCAHFVFPHIFFSFIQTREILRSAAIDSIRIPLREYSSSSRLDCSLTVSKLSVENQKLNSNIEFLLSNIPHVWWNMRRKHAGRGKHGEAFLREAKRCLDWNPQPASSMLAAVITSETSGGAGEASEALCVRRLGGKRTN